MDLACVLRVAQLTRAEHGGCGEFTRGLPLKAASPRTLIDVVCVVPRTGPESLRGRVLTRRPVRPQTPLARALRAAQLLRGSLSSCRARPADIPARPMAAVRYPGVSCTTLGRSCVGDQIEPGRDGAIISILRRVTVSKTLLSDRVVDMARPSKGDRATHMVKLHPAVTERLAEKASETGVSSVSQYAADVLALSVGLPQYVRELNQSPIIANRKVKALQGDRYGRIAIRPYREVSERLTCEAGAGAAAPYMADVLAVHVGLPEHARSLHRDEQIKEVLPLAI